MDFWKKLNTRWSHEELLNMSTVFRMAYLLFPLVIFYFVGDLIEIVLWAVLNQILSVSSEEVFQMAVTYSQTIQGVIYALGAVVCVAIINKAAGNEIRYDDDVESTQFGFKQGMMLIAVTLVLSIGLNLLFNKIGFTGVSEEFGNVNERQFGVNFYVGVILYGLISPVSEEILFRGLLYNRLKRMFPTMVAMILSSFLFGIFHGNIVQAVYGAIMGFFMAFFYEKYKNFLAPLIIHITANLGVYVLVSLL